MNNITVVIPVHNMMNKLSECFNSVYRQLYKEDQIIICDIMSTDGLSRTFFPKDKRITLFKESGTEAYLLNKSIREYSKNDCILILDPLSMVSNDFIKYLKDHHDRKRVKIYRTDKQNKKRKIIDDKNLGSKPSPELCNMYGLSFDKREGLKIGLFNEYFNRNDSCSHGILFCYIMQKINKCDLEFVESPKVIKQLGRDRKHVENKLAEYLKFRIDDGTYKYKNTNGKFTTLDEKKLKNITIIVPSKQNQKFIKEIEGQIDDKDELIVFNSGLATIEQKVESAIKKSKNDYILLLNPDMNFFVPDYVIDAKLNCDDKIKILLSDDVEEIGQIDPNNITYLEENIGMLAKIKGIHGDSGIESLHSDTNKIIKRISATPEKKKEILKRVESTYLRGRKRRERKKVKVNQSVDTRVIDRKNIQHPRYKSIDDLPKVTIKNRKPRILFICDVKGWAWWNKSHKLKEYLQDEFDIEIVSVADNKEGRRFNTGRFDLYFTFGYSYVNYLSDVPFHKRISGITAHRPSRIIEPKMRKVAITHANSMLLYEELQKMHPIVFYVPNGVDTSLFYETNPIPEERDNIVVGHVGKLCAPKGQKQIIEPAVKKSKSEYINNYSTYLKKKPIDKMIDIYNEMDVFICASLEDGTPNPALEAAACGRPIISNKIGNMPEFIKDGYNGFLVDRKIDDYVEKINYLRENRDLLIEMGNNARKTVEEEWTWEIQSERYRDMFKAILKID